MAVTSTSKSLGFFRQYMASLIAALGMLMIGMSTAWPSPVLPKIFNHTSPVHLDHMQISWMVSLMFLGNTVSPLPVGKLMDIFGRKKIMYVLNVMPLAAWVITYYGQSPWELYVSRFLQGLWAGTSYTVCAVYIGEIADPAIRGSLSNFNNLLKTLGGLFVFIIGPYVSFEMLAIFCGVVPVIFFVAAAFIPESPYFLLMRDRKQEAKVALRWLRGDEEEHVVDIELLNMEKAVIAQTQNKGSFKDLIMARENRIAFAITMLLALVKNLSGYDVMMAYTSVTLPKNAFESIGPNECVIILGVISVVTCMATIFIMDKFPRRFLLTLSSLGCAATTFVAGIWFFLNDNTDFYVQHLAQLPFYCFAIHAVVYSVGLGPIVANVKGELFSANIKGICSALTTVTFAVLSFLSTNVYLIVADNWGMYTNYLIYAASCTIGTLFIFVYVVETRGKTLHEIQMKLSEKRKPLSVRLSFARK